MCKTLQEALETLKGDVEFQRKYVSLCKGGRNTHVMKTTLSFGIMKTIYVISSIFLERERRIGEGILSMSLEGWFKTLESYNLV